MGLLQAFANNVWGILPWEIFVICKTSTLMCYNWQVYQSCCNQLIKNVSFYQQNFTKNCPPSRIKFHKKMLFFTRNILHKSAQNAGQNATDKIAKKCNGHSPSKALDFGFGKVHSGNVEHSFATAHDDGGAVANVAIHAVSFVDIR